MKFEKSEILKNLPKQFFANLVIKVNKKIAEGVDVINLGQGNPDKQTPEYIVKSTQKWVASPQSHKYSLFRGQPDFKQAIADGVIKEVDSNYFQLFSVAGTFDSIAFNCPRLLDKALNPYIDGRASILRLSRFCKTYLKGFENAYISSIASTLGVRVSNRVKGKYVYTAEDLRAGKKFENPVVVSNYPIDVHSEKKDNSILEKVYQEYQLPIESLMVKNNLFVIGRCISADFESQAALRIIPSCFSMGEGLAKYLSTIN